MSAPLPQAIIFDLDDTLYLERDFVTSGFNAVGSWMLKEVKVQDFELTCHSLFNNGQRSNIFDTALSHHHLPNSLVGNLVDIYRSHSPVISLAPDAATYLSNATKDQKFGLITDGHLVTQTAKVKSLKLDSMLDIVICTDVWGRSHWKPHSISYETVERHFDLSGASLAYVADNPSKDFVTPKKRGWRTVQISRSERVNQYSAPDNEHRADANLTSLAELNDCLMNIASTQPIK